MMQQETTGCSNNQPPIKLNEPDFSSKESYRAYCNGLVQSYIAAQATAPTTPTFHEHLAAIQRGGDMVIKTPWGGVDIIKRNDPEVEKYLVVQAGKFLAYEEHSQKVETLIGEEGLGVLVYRPEGATKLVAEFVKPGWTITLQPGQQHTLIALSNLLVREKSMDYKGMDQDLIFHFMPTDS